MNEPNYIKIISENLNLNQNQVKNTLKLIEEENTVPFIARYRKEQTGNLDENQIRLIIELKQKEQNLYDTKITAINAIEAQGKLTDELKYNLENAQNLKEVEELYAPYKKKKKTKAMIAIENGFSPIANQILNQENINISAELLKLYSKEEIVDGAKDIIIQEIADDVKNREIIRYFYKKYGEISSKYSNKIEELSSKTKDQIYKFEIYNTFKSEISKLKSYQILALNRGENLEILKVKLEQDPLAKESLIEKHVKKTQNAEILTLCVIDGYKKIFTSIEIEIRNLLTEMAENEAVVTFQDNLKKLLMTKPQYGKKVLAIDPGFRTGCKIVVLDINTNPLEFSKIFLDKSDEALKIVKEIISKYSPEIIVIGNGTASNETYDLLKVLKIPITIVNESGASIYSASDIANEEFPDLDLTDRGTISIGRRYIDPLSELVKIPAESIGVGMYQHDMNQNELKKKLSYVVEDVVNLIGINVNTSSAYLLKEVSGLDKKSAKKIVANKPYNSREQLKKVLTTKAYEQSIGFLRVPESKEILDNTSIHPEQYAVAKFIIENKINSYEIQEIELKKIYATINKETFDDILLAYKNIGIDPRKHEAALKIDKTLKFEDIKVGDILTGIVRNITQFGAFVDVGVKNDGLIHISELANKFIKNPNEVVEIGQEIKAKVIKIDETNLKLNLSLKQVEE